MKFQTDFNWHKKELIRDINNRFSFPKTSYHVALLYSIASNFSFYQLYDEQVHELTGDKLKIREVVPIDIANDHIAPADYRETEDPTK